MRIRKLLAVLPLLALAGCANMTTGQKTLAAVGGIAILSFFAHSGQDVDTDPSRCAYHDGRLPGGPKPGCADRPFVR